MGSLKQRYSNLSNDVKSYCIVVGNINRLIHREPTEKYIPDLQEAVSKLESVKSKLDNSNYIDDINWFQNYITCQLNSLSRLQVSRLSGAIEGVPKDKELFRAAGLEAWWPIWKWTSHPSPELVDGGGKRRRKSKKKRRSKTKRRKSTRKKMNKRCKIRKA